VGHLRKHLKTVALLLLTSIVLWRLWRGMSWTEVRHSFNQANGFLLASAIVVSSATNLLRAFRWHALFSRFLRPTVSEAFAATNIGLEASFVFGAAVGEVTRPLALTLLSRRVRPAVSFLTIVVERVFDLSVLFILFGLSLLWLHRLTGHSAARAQASVAGIMLLAVPFLGVGFLVLLKRRFTDSSNRIAEGLAGWRLAPGRTRRAAAHVLQQLASALSLLSGEHQLTVVTLWTIAQWLSVILTNWLILRAFGLPFGLRETILVMCFGLVGSLVPTPGGAAGAFHAAISGGLVLLGVTLERAAAISIAAHLTGFIPALVFGSYYLLSGSVSLGQLRHEMSVTDDLNESGGHPIEVQLERRITLGK
jgi:uncharacterized protein (TIRG00374 family)